LDTVRRNIGGTIKGTDCRIFRIREAKSPLKNEIANYGTSYLRGFHMSSTLDACKKAGREADRLETWGNHAAKSEAIRLS